MGSCPLGLSLALAVLLPAGNASAGPEPLYTAPMSRTAVIPLARVEAEDAAAKLRTLLGPGAEVAADKESNTILLRASARDVERARRRLARLDASQSHFIVRLENAAPVPVALMAEAVMMVLATPGGDPAVTLVALKQDRAVFFTATKAQARCLRWIIRQLDRRW